MTCHAVPGSPPPSSNHLNPSFLSPRVSRYPPGQPPPPSVPSSRHPLPHRSALMSGKNKTASPTAKAKSRPPLRRRMTSCIGKKGVAGIGDEREGTGLERRRAFERATKNEIGRTRERREKGREKDSKTKKECTGAGEREKGSEFREVRR